MAGSVSIEGLSTSLLETPTYVLAILLVFFLILTLGFEHGIHALKRTLRNRGRAGLVQAVDKAVLELTLLGFVSLILMLFQDYIPDICISYKTSQADWTLLQSLNDCPCCLSNTYGVTTCAMMSHSCAFNQTTKESYCGCSLGWPESTYNPAVVPGADEICAPYGAKEDQFIYENVLGSLVNDISPTEFCNFVANGSLTNAISSVGGSNSGGGGLRRSLLEASTSTSDIEEEGLHIVPEITTFRCEGPFYAGDCGNGSYPAISYSALHQLHLLVFTTAAMHVFISVGVVILAGMRVRQWRRWQNEDIINGPNNLINTNLAENSGHLGRDGSESEVMADANREGSSPGIGRRRFDSLLSIAEENPLPLEEAIMTERNNSNTDPTPVATVGAGVAVDRNGININEEENGENGDAPTPAPTSSVNQAASSFISEVKNAAKTFHRHWMRRDSRLLRKRHRLGESAICFGQALLPNLVSQYEFSTMRIAYVGSHKLPELYDWVSELMIHLDFDLGQIIGASLVTWAILILEWLLSGLAGWVLSLFMLIACLTVLGINIWLVAAIRFSCRGGRPHRIRSVSRWYNNPGWLSLPIGGIIFLCSTSFSSALFFWWQFGGDSCFFIDTEQELWKWLPGKLPWYAGLIGPGILLVWMAYVTIPAWALVMHMRPKAVIIEAGKKGVRGEGGGTTGVDVEKQPPQQQLDIQQQGAGERRTQAVVMAEIHKLKAELIELQAPT
ncbi:putative MLO-like protein 11 [Nannochloris sp. 'desiccata']|nr:putative MLO-like protein 11 [Chlorella desiccata (nom. nud.)]